MKEELRVIAFVASTISKALFPILYRQPTFPTTEEVHNVIADVTLFVIDNRAVSCATKDKEVIIKTAKEYLLEQGIIKTI